jgi:hypothetical protein
MNYKQKQEQTMLKEQRVLELLAEAIALLKTVEQTENVEATTENLIRIAKNFATAEVFDKKG